MIAQEKADSAEQRRGAKIRADEVHGEALHILLKQHEHILQRLDHLLYLLKGRNILVQRRLHMDDLVRVQVVFCAYLACLRAGLFRVAPVAAYADEADHGMVVIEQRKDVFAYAQPACAEKRLRADFIAQRTLMGNAVQRDLRMPLHVSAVHAFVVVERAQLRHIGGSERVDLVNRNLESQLIPQIPHIGKNIRHDGAHQNFIGFPVHIRASLRKISAFRAFYLPSIIAYI